MVESNIRRLALCASILLFASVLSTTAGRAADKNGFTAFGVGALSCGRYLSDIAENKLNALVLGSWLGGYLSAFNAKTDGVYDILEGTDFDGAIGWINNYCQPLLSG